MTEPEAFTFRQYLIRRAIVAGASIMTVGAAVEGFLRDHPQLDTKKERTWDEWEEMIGATNTVR